MPSPYQNEKGVALILVVSGILVLLSAAVLSGNAKIHAALTNVSRFIGISTEHRNAANYANWVARDIARRIETAITASGGTIRTRMAKVISEFAAPGIYNCKKSTDTNGDLYFAIPGAPLGQYQARCVMSGNDTGGTPEAAQFLVTVSDIRNGEPDPMNSVTAWAKNPIPQCRIIAPTTPVLRGSAVDVELEFTGESVSKVQIGTQVINNPTPGIPVTFHGISTPLIGDNWIYGEVTGVGGTFSCTPGNVKTFGCSISSYPSIAAFSCGVPNVPIGAYLHYGYANSAELSGITEVTNGISDGYLSVSYSQSPTTNYIGKVYGTDGIVLTCNASEVGMFCPFAPFSPVVVDDESPFGRRWAMNNPPMCTFRIECLSEECVNVWGGWWAERGCDNGCFSGDVVLQVGENSFKRADEIREGDGLWNPVLKKIYPIKNAVVGPEPIPLLLIAYANHAVKVTTQHPMLTRKGLKMAEHIHLSDEVWGRDGKYHRVTKVKKLPLEKNQIVYNFSLGKDSNNVNDHLIVANGFITGDHFLQTELIKNKVGKLHE